MRTASQRVGSEAEELPLVGPYVWDSLPQLLQCQARWHNSVHYGLLYVRREIRQLHAVIEKYPVHPRNGRQRREAGEAKSVSDLARKARIERAFLFNSLKMVNRAPDIVKAILDGSVPDGFTLNRLRKGIPDGWDKQRREFGLQ